MDPGRVALVELAERARILASRYEQVGVASHSRMLMVVVTGTPFVGDAQHMTRDDDSVTGGPPSGARPARTPPAGRSYPFLTCASRSSSVGLIVEPVTFLRIA